MLSSRTPMKKTKNKLSLKFRTSSSLTWTGSSTRKSRMTLTSSSTWTSSRPSYPCATVSSGGILKSTSTRRKNANPFWRQHWSLRSSSLSFKVTTMCRFWTKCQTSVTSWRKCRPKRLRKSKFRKSRKSNRRST